MKVLCSGTETFTEEQLEGDWTVAKDKRRLVQDQFDSEQCPLVVVLLNILANVKNSWKWAETVMSFETDTSIFICEWNINKRLVGKTKQTTDQVD